MTREDRINGLISLDEKINSELYSLQDSIGEISKHVPDDNVHGQYLSRISFIQTLFDRVSVLMRDISLNESDTKFYEALSAKNRISENYVRFGRMQNQIERMFNKEKQSETEFLEHIMPPLQQNKEDVSDEAENRSFEAEDLSEDSLLEEELIAEEERIAKKKKLVKRKADAERLKAERSAEQRQFDENERIYQENQRQAENDRRRAETDALYREQETHRQSENQYRQQENNALYRDNNYDTRSTGDDYSQPQPSYSSPDYEYTHSENYPDDRPQKQVSAADLRDEQYRQEEKREAEREADRARRQETHDKFVAYQEEHRFKDVPGAADVPQSGQSSTPTYTAPDSSSSNPRPEKPVTAADLRDQQYREEDRRANEQEQAQARRQETHEKFAAYQENQRPQYTQPKSSDSPGVAPQYSRPDIPSYSTGGTRETQFVQHQQQQSEQIHASAPKPPHYGSHYSSQHPGYAYTPSGIAPVSPNLSRSNPTPVNGSFQGVPIMQKVHTSPPSSPNKPGRPGEISGTGKSRYSNPSTPVTGSNPVRPGSAPKNEKPRAEFTHYGYTPKGVVASTAVNGKLSRSRTTYRNDAVPGSPNRGGVKTPSVPGKNGISTPGNNRTTHIDNKTLSSPSGRGNKANEQKGPKTSYVPHGQTSPKPTTPKTPKTGDGTSQRNRQTPVPRKPVPGSTGQTTRGNANRWRKKAVEETGSGLSKKSIHNRSKAIAKTYAKAVGGRTVRYGGNVLSMGARKLYGMLQEGDNNALRGFENTRYYGMAVAGAVNVLPNKIAAQRLVKKAFGEKVKLKDIDGRLDLLKEKQARALQKKFGDLSRSSGKSLAKEIKGLKEQGMNLKAQIKALESKGSALTLAERKELKKLMDKHKALSQRLRKLIGLQRAEKAFNKDLKGKQKLTNKARKLKGKNSRSIRGGLFALQRIITSPLLRSDELGVQGISKAVSLATNRHVHKFIKITLRAPRTAYRTAKAVGKGTKVVAKGTVKTVKRTVKTVKEVHSLVKTGHTAGQIAKHLTPTKIKTLPGSVAKRILKKPNAAGAKKLFQNTFKKGAQSLVGAAKAGIKGLANLSKAALVKVAAAAGIVLLFFMLMVVIISLAGGAAGSGGASSSVIMSPDVTENGKLDLAPYYDIVADEWSKYTKELNSRGKKKGADKVVVNIDSTPANAKEILSMMAVRMSQDLDLEKNDEIEPYLRYLTRQLNPFTEEINTYKCDGCETYTSIRDGLEKTYCPGHTMIFYDIDTMFFGPEDDMHDPVFSADEMGNEGQNVAEGGLIGTFEITYYAPTGNNTASGTEPKAGRTIAVDPDVIPLGTHVMIDGHEYVAEDTGGAVKDNVIDIFVDSEDEAIKKGRRYDVKVYRVTYKGSDIQESGKWDGWTAENVEWCKLIYNMDWSQLYEGVDDYIGGIAPEGDIIVKGDFVWPVTNTSQSSGYGWRIHPISGTRKFHKGTDIAVPTGTPVHAAADGTVIVSANQPNGAGLYISIDHGGGVVTKYFHNSRLLVKAGDKVKAGQVISYSGNTGASTGPHLHFEFWVNGTTVNPRVQYGFK